MYSTPPSEHGHFCTDPSTYDLHQTRSPATQVSSTASCALRKLSNPSQGLIDNTQKSALFPTSNEPTLPSERVEYALPAE